MNNPHPFVNTERGPEGDFNGVFKVIKSMNLSHVTMKVLNSYVKFKKYLPTAKIIFSLAQVSGLGVKKSLLYT